MTTTTVTPGPTPDPRPPVSDGTARDHRGSWVPNGSMIATRFLELRKRRGLMITLVLVTIGIPTVFLMIRLLLHALAPKTYGPAGGYSVYSALVSGVLYVFGFIVAATLGATAGSSDLTDGMFRHLVVTGRSRLALYLARIPAGLAIIVPMVAIGFTVVCAVCVFAAPTQLVYQNVTVPAGLSHTAFDTWAGDHADEVICNFNFRINGTGPSPQTNAVFNSVPCGNGPGGPGATVAPAGINPTVPSATAVRATAVMIADQNFTDYAGRFLSPSVTLMVRSGLWIGLYAAIGFLVGLGLSSLMGQRTVPVILLIVLEIVLTPLLSHSPIAHLLNVQRGLVGIAVTHFEPGGLPSVFGGTHDGPAGAAGVTETTAVAICVIVGWIVMWTALGAWRMVTRDA